MSRPRPGHFLALCHVAIVVTGLAYGAWRLEELQASQRLPTPQREPRPIVARHHDPSLIARERLRRILARLQPRFAGRRPKINHIDHALRMWGAEATFDEPDCLSGAELRALLLDHRAFAEAWGPTTKPFLIPDTTGRGDLDFRTRGGPATASHVDHTLACLAEIGTPTDFPVQTPRGELPLQAAIEHALTGFSLNQEEYEWSTLVWLHYLPHVREWVSHEGQRITWDRLADRLMRQRLSQGVCFGQHRLMSLAALLQRDDDVRYLSPGMRARIVDHLRDATSRLEATQHAEGYWDGGWPGVEWDGSPLQSTGPLGVRADRILATGHVLEWWLYAPAEALPSETVLRRATDWLADELEQLTEDETRRYYPFLTHAGRALALWHGQEPHRALRAEVSANGANHREPGAPSTTADSADGGAPVSSTSEMDPEFDRGADILGKNRTNRH